MCILKRILNGFLWGTGVFSAMIFVAYGAYQATTYLAGDNTLTAQSGDKLTLAKWNELVSRVRGIFTDSNGNVGIGTVSPKVALDISGAVMIKYYSTCNSTLGGTIRYNNGSNTMEFCNGTSWLTFGGSESTPGLCDPNSTIYGGKTYKQCCDVGGNVSSIGGGSSICKLSGASCPGGWTKHQNWSTTTASTTFGNCGGGCSTSSHSFSNVARESATCNVSNNECGILNEGGRGCRCNSSSTTIYANITEVGCY